MSANTFNPVLRSFAKKVLPTGMRWLLQQVVNRARELRTNPHLVQMHWQMLVNSLCRSGTRRVLNYTVHINDGPNFYVLYKDIFIHRIYHFEAQRSDPFILDCGSNIGMAVLYFKHMYPKARIIGFEPDPLIFPYLQKNITCNKLKDIQLIQAAVGAKEGTTSLYSDGKYASCLAETFATDIPEGWRKFEVPCVRLRDYLTKPVDFLKMNIEGAEWEVLAESEDHLRQVREMVIEYHHLPGLQRTLHKILELLERKGFEYLINDFDSVTNSGVQSPFHLDHDTQYYLLIYAKNRIG